MRNYCVLHKCCTVCHVLMTHSTGLVRSVSYKTGMQDCTYVQPHSHCVHAHMHMYIPSALQYSTCMSVCLMAALDLCVFSGLKHTWAGMITCIHTRLCLHTQTHVQTHRHTCTHTHARTHARTHTHTHTLCTE